MGYTKDNPPLFVQPLIEEYDLEVDSCGYKGAWAKLVVVDGGVLHIRREVSNSLTFKGYARGNISTYVTEREVAKRDEAVGNVLIDELGGFNSLEEALNQHSELRVFS